MTASTEHPHARAAQLSHMPNVAAAETGLTKNQVRAIFALQSKRRQQAQIVDPLLAARRSRPFRTRSALRAALIEQAERDNLRWNESRREVEREAARAGRRQTLLAAAGVARKMGFEVRASKGRVGRISSYYCRHPDGRALRISDHEIPWTPQRDFMARAHGCDGYDGYHGRELVITEARSTAWLRRAIVLTAAGRM